MICFNHFAPPSRKALAFLDKVHCLLLTGHDWQNPIDGPVPTLKSYQQTANS